MKASAEHHDSALLTRELPAVARRVLIIGLDGATFDVLDPMMESGRMPNLAALLQRGASGPLESTRPPITPAAWTTFMTGKSPGGHGVLDFERYDVNTNLLSFNSTQSLAHLRTIWQILSDKGLKVGAVNVPMTYPPRPVNGFVITGFETPGTDAAFTHPPDLKDDILNRWPDYTFKTEWRRDPADSDAVFADNLRRFCDSFHEGADVTMHCCRRFGWDVVMVVFKLVDNLQHKAWKYLDPRFNQDHQKRAHMAADCFRELDDALGRLFAFAEENDAAVFIMSDHGHGSLEGKAQPNLLLREWGYLVLKSSLSRAATRTRYVLDRAFSGKKGKFATQRQLDQELAVDFCRTRACVMHAGMYGFLYINLKGRQPGGIVEVRDYESLRDELQRRLQSVEIRDPHGSTIRLFPHVYKPEELYNCPREGREWMPDLMLAPADGLSVVRKIRGSSPVRWLPWRKIEGTHRLDGVYALAGHAVRHAYRARAGLIDVTPTVLAMLGLRVPDNMEGRVLDELFDPALRTETERGAAVATPASPSSGDAYSAEEEQILTQRLADLGYLE